jgi:hypothetical protein
MVLCHNEMLVLRVEFENLLPPKKRLEKWRAARTHDDDDDDASLPCSSDMNVSRHFTKASTKLPIRLMAIAC